MKQVKDCPFCGLQVDIADSDVLHIDGAYVDEPNGMRHYVSAWDEKRTGFCYVLNCPVHYGGCGCSMSGDSIQEVLDKWNERVICE